ncbi:MAG TPA: glycosyl hydrolase family 28 protein, partial [Balneolaceae bacterium]|nr:glycosyl hydrolase family 28 protein [Balneolaceae bacterium]
PTASDYRPARTYMRPYMLVIMYSKNVLIDGPTFRNSPKFALIPKYCQNLIIRNIRVDNAYWAQNGDGIDIEGGKNVAVYNNDVTAGDDGICMKSSPTDDKNFSAPALKNVIVADNVVHHGHGGFVIGSNTDGGIKNVDVRDCDFIGTDRGLRFKSYRGNGGLVQDIYVNDIYMTRIVKQAIYFNTYYHSSGKAGQPEPVTKKTPRFRDFHISHIYCDGANTAVSMTGLPEMPVKNVTLSDIRITAKHGFSANEVEHINMKNFKVLPESGTTYSLKNSRDVLFDNVAVPHNMSTFLELSGKKTSHIKFKNVKLPESKQQVKFGPEVKKNALQINGGT